MHEAPRDLGADVVRDPEGATQGGERCPHGRGHVRGGESQTGFLIRPTAATRDFGVQPGDTRALTAIKGVRDITSGVVPMVVWAVAGVPALGWALIAASITPWADMGIVLARDGRRTAAFGNHGLTAALLVVAGAALVTSG